VQTLQVQLKVWPDPVEVGRARRWTRARLAWTGVAADEPYAESLVMLVSELVTNAVVHTDRPSHLRLSLPASPADCGPYRVEVVDTCAAPPRQRRAQDYETHGRGLELVDAIADRWGWQAEGFGKVIWCEIDRACALALPGERVDGADGALLAGAHEHARAGTNST
jgi:anti-sigma regulatory factor (Ser/Thr protein kinase)